MLVDLYEKTKVIKKPLISKKFAHWLLVSAYNIYKNFKQSRNVLVPLPLVTYSSKFVNVNTEKLFFLQKCHTALWSVQQHAFRILSRWCMFEQQDISTLYSSEMSQWPPSPPLVDIMLLLLCFLLRNAWGNKLFSLEYAEGLHLFLPGLSIPLLTTVQK